MQLTAILCVQSLLLFTCNNATDSIFGKHSPQEHCDALDDNCNSQKKCWGYEDGCTEPWKWYLKPECTDEQGWRKFQRPEDKLDAHWREADFGFVKSVRDSLHTLCEPESEDDSSFVCNPEYTYCRAKDLYMDFRSDTRDLTGRLKDNTFKSAEFGGHCKYVPMKEVINYKMSLTTWKMQLDKYASLPFKPIEDGHCDVIVEKPTYFMKLDAVVNMYHHFCDFFNLYVTFHVNGSFSRDINIVLWEPSGRARLGNFGVTWAAFTSNPITHIGAYEGKRVCFKEAIFSLLPRMARGLYYNTPVIPGCFKSGLFRAFNRFITERMDIKQNRSLTNPEEPIRVALLARQTKYRQILNQKEVEAALSKIEGVHFRVLNFNWHVPFLEQIRQSHNVDVFLGMHGAGLTHMLFLPDWATAFEVYNCGDKNCYKDLARLRGVNYFTWERDDKVWDKTEHIEERYGENLKFRNFEFDVEEFTRIVKKAVEQVRRNLKSYKTVNFV